MRRLNLGLCAASLLLGACSEREPAVQRVSAVDVSEGSEAPQNEFGFKEAQEQGILSAPVPGADVRSAARSASAQARNAAGAPEPVPSDAPVARQIAYAYSWGFRVTSETLPVLQQRHRALCDRMGADCRMLSLNQSGDESYAYGSVRLQVKASRAAEFGEQLTASTQGIAAEQVSFAI